MGQIKAEITGNLVRDPELRYTESGIPVCDFRVAVTPRERRGETWRDGETQYWTVSAWRTLGENVSGSLRKGDPVTASGKVTFREYTTEDGDKRIAHEINADSVLVPLAFHTVTVKRPGHVKPDPTMPEAPFATVPRLMRVRAPGTAAFESDDTNGD
jgi:single-strand DNA-binding protein